MSLVSSLDLRPSDQWITVADEIAALLESGLTGQRLVSALWQRFPQATRYEVFSGVAMAVSFAEVDRVGLLFELQVAEARIADLEGKLQRVGVDA